MAADRAKTTLMIALIIFVMITFILAVTTYLGFQQKAKEMESARSARADMEKANRERDTAIDDARRIREVLGTDKGTADAVEAERTELFDRRFANFNKDPKSLLRLVEWLGESIKAKNDEIKALEAEKTQIRKEQETAIAEARKKQTEAEEGRKVAEENLRKETADFAARWADHEQQQGKMRTAQDQALAESERMRAITEQLAKLGPELSEDRRKRFAAAPPPGEPEPWPERVRFVFAELKDREKAINDLNAMLTKLRVVEDMQVVVDNKQRNLQDLVRAAQPADERIDGFDGRILSINPLDRTVLIHCDSTSGMRPGLVLSVYDGGDPRPPAGARKGVVEVVEVESPTLARARIRGDSPTAPIVGDDGVATSLWAPGGGQEVAVVGFVNLNADTVEDGEILRELIERTGARIVDEVSPTTSVVMDAGPPPRSVGNWPRTNETRRARALERAKALGVRVTTLDGMLDMLGLDREILDGRRRPSELGAAP